MTFLGVHHKYQIVTANRIKALLLAWEFDPGIFQKILQKTVVLANEAGLKYDYLHDRPAGSPEQMMWEGFNLSPNAKGNDWCHITFGMFFGLKPDETASVVTLAKQYVPTYKLMRFELFNTQWNLKNLVLKFDQPQEAVELEKFYRGRYGKRFATGADRGFPDKPHCSILGFRPQDESAVASLIPKLHKIADQEMSQAVRPASLQLWQDFHLARTVDL